MFKLRSVSQPEVDMPPVSGRGRAHAHADDKNIRFAGRPSWQYVSRLTGATSPASLTQLSARRRAPSPPLVPLTNQFVLLSIFSVGAGR